MVSTTAAVWVVFMTAFGSPQELPHSPQFTNQSGCVVWVRSTYGETVSEAFKLVCSRR